MEHSKEAENQYEQKIALEMERYDKLSEDMEAIQQRCESLLDAQQSEHETSMRDARARIKRVEKELRLQIDLLHDDAKHSEKTFREVLDQQEHEYEIELQQLMTAAQIELAAEREFTAEARALAQTRNTKISRLEKRMGELKMSNHARNVVLTAEKVRNAKLEATLRHFKRHMEERESTLEDKELGILHLRRKNVTLDNFRFVLDHRVEQLMKERGPITRHVRGLEAHIAAMYDELESEYYKVKRQGQQLGTKELKISTLGQEVNTLRGYLRQRDALIASFKRELSALAGLRAPNDIEAGIKRAYCHFVKEHQARSKAKLNYVALEASRSLSPDEARQIPETPEATSQKLLDVGNSARITLHEALVEARSQRTFTQRVVGNLQRKLNISKDDQDRQQQIKLVENSHLIAECNRLRGENVLLSREVHHLRQIVKDHTMQQVNNKVKITDSKQRKIKVLTQNTTKLSVATAMPGEQPTKDPSINFGLQSTQEGKLVQIMNQLDQNSRIIGTQRLEIHRLRAMIQCQPS